MNQPFLHQLWFEMTVIQKIKFILQLAQSTLHHQVSIEHVWGMVNDLSTASLRSQLTRNQLYKDPFLHNLWGYYITFTWPLSRLKFGASGLLRVQIRLRTQLIKYHVFQPPSLIILWPIMSSFPHFLNVFTSTLLPLLPVSMGYHVTTMPGQSKYTGEWKWTFACAKHCVCDNGVHAYMLAQVPLRDLQLNQ